MLSRLFDVFNGDADGICALHQWRLANPVPSAQTTLVTGVKRDIQLLKALKVGAGDTATVFDISFDSNREDALPSNSSLEGESDAGVRQSLTAEHGG